MSLYREFKAIAYEHKTKQDQDIFWNAYIPKEEKLYKHILKNFKTIQSGTLKELAKQFDFTPIHFAGFMDGINESLKKEYDVESLTEDSSLYLDVDFEKLLFNMHYAEADWLYTLPEWDALFTKEKQAEIAEKYKKSKTIVNTNKVGRNEPCPCGSGKKYKKCCG